MFITESEGEFFEDFFLEERGVFYGFLRSLGVGLDKSPDTEKCSSEVSRDDEEDVVEVISFEHGKHGFPRGIGRLSVIISLTPFRINEGGTEEVLVDMKSYAVGGAMMGGIVIFFSYVSEVKFSFFSCFYGEKGSEKSASFDFRNFVGGGLGDGDVGEFLHR